VSLTFDGQAQNQGTLEVSVQGATFEAPLVIGFAGKNTSRATGIDSVVSGDCKVGKSSESGEPEARCAVPSSGALTVEIGVTIPPGQFDATVRVENAGHILVRDLTVDSSRNVTVTLASTNPLLRVFQTAMTEVAALNPLPSTSSVPAEQAAGSATTSAGPRTYVRAAAAPSVTDDRAAGTTAASPVAHAITRPHQRAHPGRDHGARRRPHAGKEPGPQNPHPWHPVHPVHPGKALSKATQLSTSAGAPLRQGKLLRPPSATMG
jgi:hypothetical protein